MKKFANNKKLDLRMNGQNEEIPTTQFNDQ